MGDICRDYPVPNTYAMIESQLYVIATLIVTSTPRLSTELRRYRAYLPEHMYSLDIFTVPCHPGTPGLKLT